MQELYDYQFLDLKKIVLQNTSTIILGRVINLLLSVISSVLIVRYLGSERLGQYASFYAYLTLFSWLTMFGMDIIIVRDASKQREKAGQLFGTATSVSFLLSVVATILAMLGSITLNYTNALRMLLFVAAIDMLLLAPLRLSGSVFQENLRPWYGTGINVARQALWVMVIGVLIFAKAGLASIIWAHLLCSVIESLVLFLFARRFIPFRWHFNVSLARNILKESWPIALSILAVSVYQRIDQVMLHTLAGNQKLGYYVASVNISELFDIFGVALMFAMFPILSKVALQQERFEYYVKICFRYLMPFIFGICAIVTVGSGPLIKILYGKEYVLSGSVLSVLIWSEAGSFLGMIIGIALIARGLQKFTLISASVGAVVNVILNIAFIPKWGPVGAAWATVISYSLSGFFLFLLFPSARYLWVMGAKESFTPLFIGLSCVAILNSLGRPLALFLMPILYIGGLLALRVWNSDDTRMIFSVLFRAKE